MCKCLDKLVKLGCVSLVECKGSNDSIYSDFFLHGTKNGKVLSGCEKISYCPTCGLLTPTRYEMLKDAIKTGTDLTPNDYEHIKKYEFINDIRRK
ncbi:MAG: hypothetical protein WC389_19795 [Lutibacter sp.]